MALSGPQALQSLDDALRDIRREEDEVTRRLTRSAELITKFRETELDLFRQLALLRLTPDVQQDLVGRLTRAEEAARRVVSRHQAEVAEADARVKALDDRIAALAGERKTLLGRIAELQGELGELSGKIAKAIAEDPDYARQQRSAADLHAVATEAMHKTEQSEADRAAKGQPYRDDPLFTYLWELGYGTQGYKAGNLQRWLDSLVARLVGYHRARPNFAMLNEIPVRLREHAERQMEAAKAAELVLDEMENNAIDKAGGKLVRQALAEAQARIEAIDAELLVLEDDRDEAARNLQILAEGSDPEFRAAIGALAQNLEREDLKRLLEDARATRSAEDDAIIAKIDEARLRAGDEEAEAREQRDRLKTLATRRRELEDIEWEFKKARFDDPRSTFQQDDLVGDLLTDFLRGSMTASTYWDHWRNSQGWNTGTSDWGGGFSLPRGGATGWEQGGSGWLPKGGGSAWPRRGGSAGGGLSRPRSGSRGSRRSGGFKTGGGF